MIYLAPSILAADFANLETDIKRVMDAGAPYIHVDVMDGHFVPNISLGAPIAKAIRKHINGVMDVHLMITNPDQYLEDFKNAGADIVTVHLEAGPHIHRTIQRIHELGLKAGVAINPGTPVSMLEPIIEEVELVLVMSVNPGFGGQKFIPYSLQKIKQVREMITRTKKPILLQVDGGVDLGNAQAVIEAGADVLVAGSAVFGAVDVAERVKAFNTLFRACEV